MSHVCVARSNGQGVAGRPDASYYPLMSTAHPGLSLLALGHVSESRGTRSDPTINMQLFGGIRSSSRSARVHIWQQNACRVAIGPHVPAL